MKFGTLFVGALTLNDQVMQELRARSDVFLRGFLVLLFAALIAGLFLALGGLIDQLKPPASKEEILRQAQAIFEQSWSGPAELRPMFAAYPVEIASMIYELETLTPNSGEIARPFKAVSSYVGSVLATPFTFGLVGWTLFAGLLFQLTSRWLGGRAGMAQMLGLTSLAAAPQIFMSITALLALLAANTGIGALNCFTFLLSLAIAVWSLVIYVKATAVAQAFSIERAIGAIALGVGVLIGAFLLLLVAFGILISLLLIPFAQRMQ